MKKGEIWLINLNPIVGRERAGTRPVLIISGNAMNAHMQLSVVCPLSSQIKNFAGGVILTPDDTNGLKAKSEILPFQIRTVSHARFIRKIGTAGRQEVDLLIENINNVFRY